MQKVLLRFMIALFTALLIIPTGVQSAVADSNQRVATFINLAKGSQEVTKEDLKNLDPEDWRTLGVFISNFYQPFVTDFGPLTDLTGQGKENTGYTESVKKVLTDTLAYNEEAATAVTNNINNWIKNGTLELKVGFADNSKGEGLVEKPDFPLNYLTFMALNNGSYPAWDQNYEDEYAECTEEDNAGCDLLSSVRSKEYFVLYHSNGKIVYSGHRGIVKNNEQGVYEVTRNYTPSQMALNTALSAVDPDKGYANHFYDFYQEAKVDYTQMADKNNVYENSMLRSKMAVTPFGDIMVMGPNHKVVAIPGAMNPFTWKGVAPKEAAEEGYSDRVGTGTVLPVHNLQSLKIFSSRQIALTSGKVKVQPAKEPSNNEMRAHIGDEDTNIGKQAFWPHEAVNDENIKQQLKDGLERDFGSGYFYMLPLPRGSAMPDRKLSDGVPGFNTIYSSWPSVGVHYVGRGGHKMAMEVYRYVDGNSKRPENQVNATLKVFTVDSLELLPSDNPGSAFKVLYMSEGGNGVPKIADVDLGTNDKVDFTTVQQEQKTTFEAPSKADVGINKSASSLLLTYVLTNEKMVGSSEYSEQVGYALSTDTLPPVANLALNFTGGTDEDQRMEDIINWTYYLLHPGEWGYFVQWFNTKISNLLIDWHHDMSGTKNVGVLAGTTQYSGFTGYVTTPNLESIPWTNAVIDGYGTIAPFIVIAMAVLMVVYVLLGVLHVWRGVLGVLIFAIVVTLPGTTIAATTNFANSVSDQIYAHKFSYWALVQGQTYYQAIDDAVNQGDYQNYLRTLTNQQGGNADSVWVKWQAPKKMRSLMFSQKDEEALGNASTLTQKALQSAYSGAHYSEDDSELFFYRSFIDISNFSRYIFDSLENKPNMRSGTPTGSMPEGVQEALDKRGVSMKDDRTYGFTNFYYGGTTDFAELQHLSTPLSSQIVTDAMRTTKKDIEELKVGTDFVGIDQRYFNFAIPMFTQYGNQGWGTFREALTRDGENGFKPDIAYQEKDFSGMAAYGLMSESPFYYYSWQLYESGLKTGTNATGGFKNMILDGNDGAYFYNTRTEDKKSEVYADGNLKDYLDMKSLFTYTIPYLKQGNDVVRAWDEVYGIKVYEGISTEEGKAAEYENDPEAAQKYWHNLNVARLYNIYSPWVDMMYDSSYAKPTKVKVYDEDILITDPLNPASYPEERPMVFSQSEANAMGLDPDQLTEVEKRIIKFNKENQENMFNLLNYHSYNDSVLNSVAAMESTFTFNKIFSDINPFGTSYVLEPQSYELKNFNYDAFQRMILSNSTGESITDIEDQYHGDLYRKLSDNSSIFFGLFLLINDVISIYAIPLLRFFTILVIFVLSLMMIFSAMFKVRNEMVKNAIQGLIIPSIGFLLISIGMAWVVSLFMGSGLSSITGDRGITIQVGDPTMTLVVMVIINVTAGILYFKLARRLTQEVRGYTRDIRGSLAVAGGGVATAIGSAAASAGGQVSNSRVGQAVSGAYRNAQQAVQQGVGAVSNAATTLGITGYTPGGSSATNGNTGSGSNTRSRRTPLRLGQRKRKREEVQTNEGTSKAQTQGSKMSPARGTVRQSEGKKQTTDTINETIKGGKQKRDDVKKVNDTRRISYTPTQTRRQRKDSTGE